MPIAHQSRNGVVAGTFETNQVLIRRQVWKIPLQVQNHVRIQEQVVVGLASGSIHRKGAVVTEMNPWVMMEFARNICQCFANHLFGAVG